MGTLETLIAIVGLGVVTLLSRCLFLLPDQDVPMPRWLREGLRYAPLAALAAVIAPEIVMAQGQLVATWRDARLFGAAAGLGWYLWRGDLLGTIVCGTGVMMLLKFVLGW